MLNLQSPSCKGSQKQNTKNGTSYLRWALQEGLPRELVAVPLVAACRITLTLLSPRLETPPAKRKGSALQLAVGAVCAVGFVGVGHEEDVALRGMEFS